MSTVSVAAPIPTISPLTDMLTTALRALGCTRTFKSPAHALASAPAPLLFDAISVLAVLHGVRPMAWLPYRRGWHPPKTGQWARVLRGQKLRRADGRLKMLSVFNTTRISESQHARLMQEYLNMKPGEQAGVQARVGAALGYAQPAGGRVPDIGSLWIDFEYDDEQTGKVRHIRGEYAQSISKADADLLGSMVSLRCAYAELASSICPRLRAVVHMTLV